MEEKAPKEFSIPLNTSRTDVQLLILSKVMNLPRILLLCTFSLALLLLVISVGRENEASVPIAIFIAILFGLFLLLLLNVLARRPRIKGQILSEENRKGSVLFTQKGFRVSIEGQKARELAYKDIRGQYWFTDFYLLQIDSRDYSALLNFSVDRESFDLIYMLADALNRRKVKLIQIGVRRKEK